ncbi:MAG: HesA/MoeB/ThiF family protein [Candidatus Woesearchaeota archaeon]
MREYVEENKIPTELIHKLQDTPVTIIGNPPYLDILLANVVGLGVENIFLYQGAGFDNSSLDEGSSTKGINCINDINLFGKDCVTHFEVTYKLVTVTPIDKIPESFVINASTHDVDRDIGNLFLYADKDKSLVSTKPLPAVQSDFINGSVISALAVDEFRKHFFRISEIDTPQDLILYNPLIQKGLYPKETFRSNKNPKILMVGAGGIGNYCGVACAKEGYNVHVVDGDVYENKNLHRQMFCKVGDAKAQRLCSVVKDAFGLDWTHEHAYLDENYPVENFDVILGCVDNIRTRKILQQLSVEKGIPYLDGGVEASFGQVTYKRPIQGEDEPVLEDGSCLTKPNPSVIMTNCIIGNHMAKAIPFILESAIGYRFSYSCEYSQRINEEFYDRAK